MRLYDPADPELLAIGFNPYDHLFRNIYRNGQAVARTYPTGPAQTSRHALTLEGMPVIADLSAWSDTSMFCAYQVAAPDVVLSGGALGFTSDAVAQNPP